MLDTIFEYTATDVALTWQHALWTLLTAFILGAVISVTYMKTQPNYTTNFALTLIILPSIVGIIILLIGSNIARAFSLAGAFSIIRFRSAAGDPKDIAYVLFSMAAGLACGVGAFGYAVLFTVALCLLMMTLHLFRFGTRKAMQQQLKVTIPENLAYEDVFREVFQHFNVDYDLKRVRTTELGSLYELIYTIALDKNANPKALLDAIRIRNGNLDISLTMTPPVAEGY
ncbi:DUF4956 domain-containing protein [Paenibacillus sp. 598K]|uniref:DUF4956 domain-containing protein n=1 Tax=Paenibacillus sp. 598K TaxID=1117987 RepID=UPI000FF994AE|nr:DUF4956 domain-containing protein [Paenibacillus sp. 598K]GBF78040.1 DUF4956 domain-containing protein [Paenibacillus sp. 598K]